MTRPGLTLSPRLLGGVIAACLAFTGAGFAKAQSPVVTKILDQGSNATRINIVLFSEGYTASELITKFPTDAAGLLDALLGARPYSDYRSFFNAYTIAVPSNQSGSDHYTPSVALKETYFNSTYDSYGIQRLVTIPPNDRDGSYANGRGKIDTLLMNHVPDYDLVMLVVNDDAYGGSGGPTLITSTNSASAEIAIHESGHTFANLGDEYSDPYPGFPDIEKPNTTRQIIRNLIKWNTWILPTTPVPTPDISGNGAVVGLFEGAHYQTTGWYRPKQYCRMRAFGPPFCEVCTEAIVLSMHRAVGPIESFTPASPSVTAISGHSLLFSILKKMPSAHGLAVQWSINNVTVTGAVQDQFCTSTLAVGMHEVRVTVTDPTALVRNDPTGLLRGSQRWSVQIIGRTAAKADFNGDGFGDLAWQNASTGERVMWFLRNGVLQSGVFPPAVGTDWLIAGTADFNADGFTDLVWQHVRTGHRALWLMRGATMQSAFNFAFVDPAWSIAAAADFNGDGFADLVWQNPATGERAIWFMSNGQFQSGLQLQTVAPEWSIAAAGDLNGDGFADLVWQNRNTGERVIWFLQNGQLQSGLALSRVTPEWRIANH